MSAVLHLSTLPAALLADSANDPESTRQVYLLAGGLTLLGLVLIVVTVWFWRNTRHDPELLGPLEAMGARKFARLDSRTQQQLLDSVRPPDARPLRSAGDTADAAPSEKIDLKAARSAHAAGYDDLRDVPAAAPAALVAETGVDPADEVAAGEVVDDRLIDAAPADGAADDALVDDALVDDELVDDEVAADEVAADAVTSEPREMRPAPIAAASSGTTRSDAEPSSDAGPDSTAETEIDEFAILDADRRRSASDEATTTLKPEPVPLVIVPMDHDLPNKPVPSSSQQRAGVATDSDAAVETDSAETDVEADAETSASIDPLLRRRD